MEQNAALLQVNIPAGGFERKNGVRPDTRDGLIGRGQLGAGIRAGAHEIGRFDDVFHPGRLRRFGGLRNDVHILDDLGECAFRQ